MADEQRQPSFDNSYARELPDLCTQVKPAPFVRSEWVVYSSEVAESLGLEPGWEDAFLEICSGRALLKGMDPIAQKYMGHQFGFFNAELGDGRGLLLGELINNSKRFDLHLKGAGKTPYSRFGDGRAVLRSTIREFLASEALHHLGIPTSRALGMVRGDETVIREQPESGAMLIRVCPSHLRFGHFEHYLYTRDEDGLKRLIDYTCQYVLPDSKSKSTSEKALHILESAVKSTALMIAKWQAFGFTHGVMNTDNMSILGITFDYGPYGFMDTYEPAFVCNHTDKSGRYAFEEQPSIGLWNLNRLAHALSPFIEAEQIQQALKAYEPALVTHYSELMRNKLGLSTEQQGDSQLVGQFLQLLESQHRDYTNSFRWLSTQKPEHWKDNFVDTDAFENWRSAYSERLKNEGTSIEQAQQRMQQANPKYILRNYLAQQVIAAAEQGDYQPVRELFEVLKKPYDEQPGNDRFAKEPPESARGLALSCSS